jgi:polygalacturonase
MICLKAGRNQDAWDVGKSCEDVLIRNCRGVGECRSGGIVIGSEMSGSVRNVRAENCEFENNINCVRIKSKDGRGGAVENIEYKNLKMKKGMRGINLTFRYSSEATDAPEVPGKYMPEYRNIYFENIECDNLEIGIAIDGVPGGKMENIFMKDINMRAEQCMTADSISGLNMQSVNLEQIKVN